MAPLRLGDLFDAPRARGAEPSLLVLEGVPIMRPQTLAGIAQQNDQFRLRELLADCRDYRGRQDEIGRAGLASPRRPERVLELRVIGSQRVFAPEMREVPALLFRHEKSAVGGKDLIDPARRSLGRRHDQKVRRMIAQPARALCRQPALVFLPGRPDFGGGNRSPTGRRGGLASAPVAFFRSGVGRAGSPAAVSNSLHALLLLGPGALNSERGPV